MMNRRIAPVAALLVATTSLADPPADPPTDPPVTQEKTETEAGSGAADTPADPPPSLDDLLGIGSGKDDEAADADADDATSNPNAAELDRALGGKPVGQLALEVLESMQIASTRLKDRRTGLVTQRTQEDVIKRLEMLMDAAAQQQSQQQQSSSSSSSSQQQQQQDPGQQRSSQQQQSEGGEQSGQESETAGSEAGEGTPPGFDGNVTSGSLEESRTEWGSLPERVRDMLLQGRQERFSSLYERLTREYYRRLAEEGSNR